jgi:hypothetical protein
MALSQAMASPKKEKVSANKQPPIEHPKPYKSALWDHFDAIQKLRRRREPWQAIADHLNRDHQLAVSYKTVQRFFKRAIDPKTNKRKALPLGFSASVTERESPIDHNSEENARERLRAEATQQQKEIEERESKWKFGSLYEEKSARKK